MVPELEEYKQYTILTAVAKQERISNKEALQMPYDAFMYVLGQMHHTARWMHEYNAIQAMRSTAK